MVAGSSDTIFVTMEEYNRLTEMLNLRQSQIQQKFVEVDQKLQILDSVHGARMESMQADMTALMTEVGDHQGKMTYLNNQAQVTNSAIEHLEQMQQSLIGEVSSGVTQMIRNADELNNKIVSTEQTLAQADTCVRNLNDRLVNIERKSSGNDGDRTGKGLLDPRVMTVGKFDGSKVGEFVGWRDGLEKMVNEYHSGLRDILRAVRKHKNKMTEAEFDNIVRDMGINVKWNFGRVNYELGTYLLTKLDLKAKAKAESVALTGGFEMFRVLSEKYDKVTADAESLLLADIAKLGGKQCRDVRELDSKVTDLERAIDAFTERIGKAPDESLLGSILTAMLDPQTKREFINIGGMIGNFEKMKSNIAEISGDMQSSVPMDTSLVCLPCEEPPELDALGQQRPPNPEIVCWTCGEKGHPARLCPKRPAAPPGQQTNKGGGKGQTAGGKGGKGWWGKGGSKGKSKGGFRGGGKGEKGKGAYGLEAAPGQQNWWGDQWFPDDDAGIRNCASIERHRPQINVITREPGSRFAALSQADQEYDDEDKKNPEGCVKADVSKNDLEMNEMIADVGEGLPWNVKVSKGKKRKLNKNQRRAVARKPKCSYNRQMTAEEEMDMVWKTGRKTIEEAVKNLSEEERERMGFKEMTKEGISIGFKGRPEVSILERAKPEINKLENLKGGWEPIELTVDSGAENTVTGPDTMNNIEADVENADEEGFVVADGSVIPLIWEPRQGLLQPKSGRASKEGSFKLPPCIKLYSPCPRCWTTDTGSYLIRNGAMWRT